MKHVLFDLEGTLIDSKNLQVKVLKYVFDKFGVDYNDIDMISLIGPPLILTFQKYFGQNAQKAMEFYAKTFKNIEIKDIYVNEEIKKALPILKQCNFNLVTTSLQIVDVVERELKYLGIYDYFDLIVGDNEKQPYSSKADLVSKALKDYNLESVKTCLVGDTEFDKECAEKNKIKFIGVSWGYGLKNDKNCVSNAEDLLNRIDDNL